jgi:predicted ATPase
MKQTNNWHVITGTTCAGKSTLLEFIEQKGFKVVPEAARTYIDEEIKKGNTLAEIRKDELLFQKNILKLKIEIEKKLSPEEIIFFDRGIPDSEAYYKLLGHENDKFLQAALKNCFYKKIFLLDFFEIKQDYARTETREDQIKIHNLLLESYKKSGIQIVRVPEMETKAKRAEFVLAHITWNT